MQTKNFIPIILTQEQLKNFLEIAVLHNKDITTFTIINVDNPENLTKGQIEDYCDAIDNPTLKAYLKAYYEKEAKVDKEFLKHMLIEASRID